MFKAILNSVTAIDGVVTTTWTPRYDTMEISIKYVY